MPENKYEKRKKQKKRNAIIASVSFTGVAILGILAFLGRDIGSFTVKLQNDSVKLSLSKKYASEEKSSFLLVETIPSFEQMTYKDLPSDVFLDNENYDYMMEQAANKDPDTGDIVSLNFFKYTFYVSNEGNKPAAYDVDFKVVDDVKSTDGSNRSLLSSLHVVIYENSVIENNSIQTHSKEIYARAPEDTTRRDENGNSVNKEYVSVSPEKATAINPFEGFATPFVMDSNNKVSSLAKYHSDYLGVSEYTRYTFVCYLEGQDLSDVGYDAPEGASLKLEINVNGYESKKTK